MAVLIQSVEESIEDSGIKILVHSPAGGGKTVFCATADEPTLIINAESGMLSLGQNIENLRNNGSPTFNPKKCSVATVSTIDELSEVYDMLVADIDDRKFQWIGLDSITEIAEVVLANELKKSPDPRKAYGQLQTTVLEILKAYRDLKHYDVIMSCKQQRITDQESGITSFVPMMPGSKLYQQIPYLFDEVFCLRIGSDEDGNSFTYIQAVRDVQYEAKDRSGTLSHMEPPSLKMLKETIRGGNHNIESEEVKEAEEEIPAAGEDVVAESKPKVSKKIDLDVSDEDTDVIDD